MGLNLKTWGSHLRFEPQKRGKDAQSVSSVMTQVQSPDNRRLFQCLASDWIGEYCTHHLRDSKPFRLQAAELVVCPISVMCMHLQRRGLDRHCIAKLLYASFSDLRVASARKAKWGKVPGKAILGCVMEGDGRALSGDSRLDFDAGRLAEEKAARAAHARVLAAANLGEGGQQLTIWRP